MEITITKTIETCVVEHRGEKRVKLVFKYDDELIEKVRKIPGRKWSQTMGCWHVPYSDDYIDKLKRFLPTDLIVNDELLINKKDSKSDGSIYKYFYQNKKITKYGKHIVKCRHNEIENILYINCPFWKKEEIKKQ